jgi:hypothetical protein
VPVPKRARLLSFLLFLFSPAVATQIRAATYTAASCSYSDVNAVINGPTHTAANGDIINIPAGTCTWTSNLVVPGNIGIVILGSGTPDYGSSTTGASSSCTATKIIDNAGSSTFLMSFSPTSGNSTTRASCLDIEPNSTSTTLYAPFGLFGTCTSSGCPNVRVDNITFGNSTPWTEANNGSQAAAMIRVDNVFGVLDHNTAPSGSNVELFNAQMTAYLGVGANGDNSWAQADSLGGASNIFAENNSWYTQYLGLNDCEAGAIGGCRVVDRYNTMNESSNGSFGIFENHGTETAGRGRSGREAEVYNNTLTCQLACAGVDGGLRGGTGMFWGNHAILTPGEGANTWLGISLYRTVGAFTPWGACGGSGGYDHNDGVTYYSGTMTASGGLTLTDSSKSWTTNQFIPMGFPYSVYDVTQGFWAEIASNTATTITINSPISESGWTGFNSGDSYQVLRATECIDAPGKGGGTYLSGTTPTTTGWVGQPLDPIYQWADSFSGGANVNSPIQTDSGKVINNRDYYAQASGIQTSSTSPFNGTSGTGWGTLANRPTTCSTGVGYAEYTSAGALVQLDKCTATNAWTSKVYTPYTYPHPLDSNGSVATDPSPATNLTATVQ